MPYTLRLQLCLIYFAYVHVLHGVCSDRSLEYLAKGVRANLALPMVHALEQINYLMALLSFDQNQNQNHNHFVCYFNRGGAFSLMMIMMLVVGNQRNAGIQYQPGVNYCNCSIIDDKREFIMYTMLFN